MTNDFMKSALDRAMERADRIQVPEEKLREMEHRSEAERIAAGFLREPEFELAGALGGYDPEKAGYLSKLVADILLQNVTLPRREPDLATNEKVFMALYVLKQDKAGLDQAKQQLDNLANYYTQARKQNFDQLKADVERALSQAMQQRTGMQEGVKFNVEQTPEFQENWRQLSAKLDSEYDKALAQLKQQVIAIE